MPKGAENRNIRGHNSFHQIPTSFFQGVTPWFLTASGMVDDGQLGTETDLIWVQTLESMHVLSPRLPAHSFGDEFLETF